MDHEASVEKKNDAEKILKEEVIQYKEQVRGKDQAIKALGLSLMEKATEHEKMSEMLNLFKNNIMNENCFHVNYGAKKLGP